MTVESITHSAGATLYPSHEIVTASGTLRGDTSHAIFNSSSNLTVRVPDADVTGKTIMFSNIHSTGSVTLSLDSGGAFDNSTTTIRVARGERGYLTAVGSQQWTVNWLPTPGSEVVTATNHQVKSLSGVVILAGSDQVAGTLFDPEASDDGKEITFVNGAAFANDVSQTNGLLSGNYSSLSLGTLIGSVARFVAYNGTWWGDTGKLGGTFTAAS